MRRDQQVRIAFNVTSFIYIYIYIQIQMNGRRGSKS